MSDGPESRLNGWGYREGMLFSFGLVCLGGIMEYGLEHPAPLLSYPLNIIALAGIWGLLWIVHYLYAASPLVRWLGSVRFAVMLLLTLFILSFGAGVIPQQDHFNASMSRVGLTHITSSWAFVYVMIALLMNLGFACLRWINRKGIAAAGFSANHLGVWIVLAAGICSAGDRQHVVIELLEGQTIDHGQHRATGRSVRMPFSIELHDFSMDVFDPPILLFDSKGTPVVEDTPKLGVLARGQRLSLEHWEIEVLEYYRSAKAVSEGFLVADSPGSVCAALVRVKNSKNGSAVEDWISTGSFASRPRTIKLENGYVLGMPQPQPRTFTSVISVSDAQQMHLERYELQVNKPAIVGSWQLFQQGYDESRERWSQLSVIEAIYDPWLWLVYLGLALMALGTCYIVFVKACKGNVSSARSI